MFSVAFCLVFHLHLWFSIIPAGTAVRCRGEVIAHRDRLIPTDIYFTLLSVRYATVLVLYISAEAAAVAFGL